MSRTRIIILGDAGRGFHNFNVYFRDNLNYQVIAFVTRQTFGSEARSYPAEFSGKFYPNGIPIYPESQLEYLIIQHSIEQVIFTCDDTPGAEITSKAAQVNALGADFRLMGTASTQIRSKKPVITVCAVHPRSGKSLAARQVAIELQKLQQKAVVVRHPMPSQSLTTQAVKRFAEYEDMDTHQCSIEEREEYEPYLDRGIVIYTGHDYAAILEFAETEADVIVWDGGSNDLPFLVSDYHIMMADPHRAGRELNHFPGESNIRMADLVIINKVDTANYADILRLRENIRILNKQAVILEAAAPLAVIHPHAIRGKRVLVVEDGVHPETAYGAVAAQRFGAAEMVDPRPFAVNSIAETFAKDASIGHILPVRSYGESELRDVEDTINNSDADLVIAATPIDLQRVMHLNKPVERVRYELQIIGTPTLADLLAEKYGE